MKKLLFFMLLVTALITTSCKTNNEEQPKDAFAGLTWNNEFCDNKVGFYRKWFAMVYSKYQKNVFFVGMDSPILKKQINEINFRDSLNFYGKKPELDLGTFKYKIVKKSGNSVVIEFGNDFIEDLVKKNPEYKDNIGRYFVFEPIHYNSEKSGSEYEYRNCELAVASCKTLEKVNELLASNDNWYFGYYKNCEKQKFATCGKDCEIQ